MDGHDAVTSYDSVPYESFPYARSHPNNLAVLARLFALKAPDVPTARILELGCGCGGNLIPIAAAFPETQCLGLDLSGRQLDIARSFAAPLELSNLEFRQADLSEFTPDAGSVDYLICHGVFSWVPDAVRRRILEISSTALAPDGIAYISFNTYPGWHLRQSIREMMSYHAGGFESTSERIAQSRALLQFLIEATPNDGTAYHTMLRDELNILSVSSDSYLFHEHLEDHNQPLYFHEFMSLAHEAKLRFLGEADFSSMVSTNLTAEVSQTLSGIAGDIIQMEQYQDFIRNRMFRSTLLCHQDQVPDRHVTADRLADMFVAAPLQAHDRQDGEHEYGFSNQYGIEVSLSSEVQALALLSAANCWPQAIAVRELLEVPVERLQLAGSQLKAAQNEIPEMLLTLYSQGLIELHGNRFPFTAEIRETPEVFAVARAQATASHQVTNLRHESVKLDDLQRFALPMFDGSCDRQSATRKLWKLCQQGQLNASLGDGSTVDEEDRLLEALSKQLERALESWAQQALLVG